MDDLIRRQDAMQVLFKSPFFSASLIEELKALPSAEAEPSLKAIKRQIDEHWYLDPPSAEAVQGDAISKRFISDAILQKISELNAQGEKAIPIAREFIRFKRFVDGLTPIRTDAVSFDDAMQIRNTILFKEYMRGRRDAVRGWIPCSERLPKKGEVVLITNGKGNVRCGQYRSEYDVRDGTHYWWWKGKTVESVIAWMPLPKPYKGGDGE